MERVPDPNFEVNVDKMIDFAEWLACYGIRYSDNSNFEEQRMAVVLLDQSVEVMMNAFLIGKGYEIFGLRNEDVVRGLKKSESPNNGKTPDFPKILKAVKDNLPNMDKEAIEHFHEIRNKVYHGAAVTLRENKLDEMERYIPKLEEFYNSAFPGRSFSTNVRGKVRDITSRINQRVL